MMVEFQTGYKKKGVEPSRSCLDRHEHRSRNLPFLALLRLWVVLGPHTAVQWGSSRRWVAHFLKDWWA